MGVLRFFKYVLDHFRDEAIQCLYSDAPLKGRNVHAPDVLLIDCNAVFHPACRSVYEDRHPRLLGNAGPESELDKKRRAFKQVCKDLERLICVGNPSKAIYLAIDGVAGCCKQAQQRKRRFKSAKDAEHDPEAWNSSVLTVGTEFMNELSIYIREHFENCKWIQERRLRILINDHCIPGEGEHKLVRFVENDRQYRSYCIYSPDADLIMLGMLLPKPFVSILRENIYKFERAKYFLVNMYHLKKAFVHQINQISLHQQLPVCVKQLHADYMIKDVVTFFFLLGNDFLPHVPSIEILNEGIETLLDTYAKVVYQRGYLIHSSGKLEGQFNRDALLLLLEELTTLEPLLLYRKATEKSPPIPDSVLMQSVDSINKQIDMSQYRKLYYERNFGCIEDRDQICHEYLRGIVFVIRYYTKQIPTFEWFYPYHYAPLFSDLLDYVRRHDRLEYDFLFKAPLTPVEALASVLPPSSFYLLPEKVCNFLTNRSFIDERFPSEFQVDEEGKMQSYEATILLPMIPYDEIRHLLKSFELTHPPGVIVDICNNSSR